MTSGPSEEVFPVARDRPAAAGPERRRLPHFLLSISRTINVLGTGFFAVRAARKGGIRYLMERVDLRDAVSEPVPFQVDKRAEYRRLPHTEGEIVFVGDSLVNGGPWAEFYGPIKNRGIGGETVAGVLDRLDDLTKGRPQKIFLLIGTNDLAADVPIAQIVRGYRKILERIRSDSPRTRIYALSVTPVNQGVPRGPVHNNGQIQDLNSRLRALADEFDHVEYVDIYSALTDTDGSLRRDLTVDGLHLNLEAYLILNGLLRDFVNGRERPRSTGEEGRESATDQGPSK
jgi:lysophospholipase L1-like esterase